MKHFAFVFLAVIAVGLIGCTDNTSVTDAAMSSFVQQKPAPEYPGNGTWIIDRIVYSTEMGASYHVSGTIAWYYSKYGESYAFSADADLRVLKLAASKSQPIEFRGVKSSKGDLVKELPVSLVHEFFLPHEVEVGTLHLEYNLGAGAELSKVSIVCRTPLVDQN